MIPMTVMAQKVDRQLKFYLRKVPNGTPRTFAVVNPATS